MDESVFIRNELSFFLLKGLILSLLFLQSMATGSSGIVYSGGGGGTGDRDGRRKEEIAQREREREFPVGTELCQRRTRVTSPFPPGRDQFIVQWQADSGAAQPVRVRAKQWRRYLFAGLAEALQALLELTAVVLRRLDALLRLLQEQVHLHRHPPAS